MNDRVRVSAALSVARWSARILSGMILLVWGYFLLADLLGEAGEATRPLTWGNATILASLVVSLLGLAIAWRWEAPGATIALVGIFICAAVNWKVLIFPGALIPITAVLFLSAWWLSRMPPDEKQARAAD